MILVRGEELVQIQVAPAPRWGLVADGSRTELQRQNPLQAMHSGLRETYIQSKTLLVVLGQMITGQRSAEQLGSFITIGQVLDRALSVGFFALLSIIALLSVNLAVINLFPIPALDGGYLTILTIEAITRRKLGGRGMMIAIMIGWFLILSLIAFTMWNDIMRLIG